MAIKRRIMPWVEATASADARLRSASVALDGRLVLRDVDLALAPGVTAVRGPNGAGKTTLLRALAGLVPLTGGSRTVSGELLYLGHRSQLLRGLTAADNLRFFARFRGASGAGTGAALAAWGVDPARRVEVLSAGQRRRAALARIDAEPCAVTLLDEPFAELDSEGVALLEAALRRAAAAGRIVAVATHGHDELDASRTVRLADGAVS